MLPILAQSERFIVVNKPAGMLVHKTDLAGDNEPDVLRTLRDQIGQQLYPVHRLDRATSGAMIFAKDSEYAQQIQSAMELAKKQYLLVCRGHILEPGTIDHPLKRIYDSPSDKRKRKRGIEQITQYQSAITHYKPIATTTLDAAIDRYPTSRFSLVEATIDTGRRHQIRRHFKHLSHPLIGCPKYGKSNYNRYFAENLNISRLLLHAQQLSIDLPEHGNLEVTAPFDAQFERAVALFN